MSSQPSSPPTRGQAPADTRFDSSPVPGPCPLTTLRTLYRLAIENGGDAISKAHGHVEARLVQSPNDRQALMFKGSLLTLIGEGVLTAEKKADYIRTGIKLMNSAIANNGDYPAMATELALIRATTLAILPDAFDQQSVAEDALLGAIAAPDFHAQDAFDRTRSLSLLACLHQSNGRTDDAKSLFQTARSCDQALAIKTYSDWLERQ